MYKPVTTKFDFGIFGFSSISTIFPLSSKTANPNPFLKTNYIKKIKNKKYYKIMITSKNAINWSEMNIKRKQIPRTFHFKMSRSKAWDVVIKMIKLDGKKILDFGCSRGEFFDFLKSKGVKFEAVGYDIDKSLKKLNLKFRIYSDLNKIKEKFDIVTMFEVIEHMKPDEAMEKIKMLRNVLKEGGTLIISTRNISSLRQAWEFWYDITHVRPYPIKDLIFLVENCGFEFVDLVRTECSINPFYLILCIMLRKDWCNGYVAIFRKK